MLGLINWFNTEIQRITGEIFQECRLNTETRLFYLNLLGNERYFLQKCDDSERPVWRTTDKFTKKELEKLVNWVNQK